MPSYFLMRRSSILRDTARFCLSIIFLHLYSSDCRYCLKWRDFFSLFAGFESNVRSDA